MRQISVHKHTPAIPKGGHYSDFRGQINEISPRINDLQRKYFKKSLKTDILPLSCERRVNLFQSWYNIHRPHDWLKGRMPDEAYNGIDLPKNEQPRYEPRPLYPVTSPCASPQAPVRGSPGARLELCVTFLDEGGLLPIVELKQVA